MRRNTHNLELRMMVRRLTRLTLSYSKKLSNHKAMLALAIAFHNFCSYHAAIRATPCMARFTDSNNLKMSIIAAPGQL